MHFGQPKKESFNLGVHNNIIMDCGHAQGGGGQLSGGGGGRMPPLSTFIHISKHND